MQGKLYPVMSKRIENKAMFDPKFCLNWNKICINLQQRYHIVYKPSEFDNRQVLTN